MGLSTENKVRLPIFVYPEIIFPGLPGEIESEKSSEMLEASRETNGLIGIITEKKNLPQTGMAISLQAQRLPSFLVGYSREPEIVMSTGMSRIKILEYLEEPWANVEIITEEKEATNQTKDLIELVKKELSEVADLFKEIRLFPSGIDQILQQIQSTENPAYVADWTMALLGQLDLPFHNISSENKVEILETLEIKQRLYRVYELLLKEKVHLQILKGVKDKSKEEARRRILREERDTINKELGEGESEEVKKFRERAEAAQLPEEALRAFNEDLEKFSGMDSRDPNRQYIQSWLEWMVSIPWSQGTEDRLDISQAEEILEEDHYGLEEVKKRIIEFLAVKRLRPEGKGSLLCFIGPPGTGKTSVGRSIARAMGRKFIRISLGGVYDEAQIRGHRRTYVGALPGIIIQELKRVGSNNPVFMIDEIDKIGTQAFHGDPSSALLEVLDPEQNKEFTDHYLNVPFDLSKVMFICTGNLADPIQPALRDRMEIIDFAGYTREEKLQIAKKYLVPRQIEENGLKESQLRFEEEALQSVIRDYTREAGVRNLEREIKTVCRRTATQITKNEISQQTVTLKNLSQFLGPKKYISQLKVRISRPGVAIGLAWTAVGGEILFIEAEMVERVRRPDLEITGNIAKIMQESARTALTYVGANFDWLVGNKDRPSPRGNKIHIHVPEAAVPKDGPSAGLAIFIALVSLLRKQSVRDDVAMTGEITLRGKVMPVGGIKEKVLAAKEAGIKTIILPEENEKDLSELPQSVKEALDRKEIKIELVSEMTKALEIAFPEKSESEKES